MEKAFQGVGKDAEYTTKACCAYTEALTKQRRLFFALDNIQPDFMKNQSLIPHASECDYHVIRFKPGVRIVLR